MEQIYFIYITADSFIMGFKFTEAKIARYYKKFVLSYLAIFT